MNTGLDTITASEVERIKADSFVRAVEYHRELPSTNDRALELATCEELETPLLVLALSQTSGRGRGINQWWSAPGALTCSLVLDASRYEPTGACDPRLSVTTALALHEALGEHLSSCDIKLKWPNDVYVGSRKVAGILIERSTACPGRLVVGLGINVNNSLEAAPDEVRHLATSLRDSNRRMFPMADVLLAVLNRIAKRFQMLTTDAPRLSDEWQQRCLLHTRVVSVTVGGNVVTGVCNGIDDQGALMIHNDSGVHRFSSGVVRSVV